MAKFYKRINIVGTDAAEKLSDLLTSTVEEPKHITALWFTESGATLYHNAILRAYVEREKIVDFRYTNFALDDDQDDRMMPPRLEIDMDLPVGQTLSVGFLSGATASTFDIAVEYEITS